MAELIPSIPVELDKPRTLRFDLNAVIAYERATGKSIRKWDPMAATDEERLVLIWACLLHEERTLKKEDVGAMLCLANMTKVYALAVRAVVDSMPQAKKEDPGPQT